MDNTLWEQKDFAPFTALNYSSMFFFQITDLHLEINASPKTKQHLQYFFNKTLQIINPAAVIATGMFIEF